MVPRSYESATVLFCQLVDFSTVLSKFPPNQVIDFLNQVFSTFDHIIRNHDAYKVETTGEVRTNNSKSAQKLKKDCPKL